MTSKPYLLKSGHVQLLTPIIHYSQLPLTPTYDVSTTNSLKLITAWTQWTECIHGSQTDYANCAQWTILSTMNKCDFDLFTVSTIICWIIISITFHKAKTHFLSMHPGFRLISTYFWQILGSFKILSLCRMYVVLRYLMEMFHQITTTITCSY